MVLHPSALAVLRVATSAALFAASVGCSSAAVPKGPGTTSTGDSSPDAAGSVGCSGQGDTYSANLTKQGTLGVYTFTLVEAAPAPPAQYANVWTLKVTDKSGAPPGAAKVSVVPFMPLMGHGSDQVPTVTSNADGTFTVTDVYLFMQGLWTVTISVTEPTDGGSIPGATPVTLDKAVYTFCID
jgi:hypothetical protein